MKFRNEYWFLSNFYPCKIEINGLTFQCAESAFQACKSLNPRDWEKLTKMNGAEAKKFGRKISLRPDWNERKLRCMYAIVNAKFNQNNDLLKKLCDVNEPIVEENDWNDTYWGVCKNRGENHLGKIISKVRAKEIKRRNDIRRAY